MYRMTLSAFSDEIDPMLEKQIPVLKRCGISYIEIRGVNGKGIDLYSLGEAVRIKKELKDNGISVSAVGSPIGKISITDDFEPHFQHFRHVVELAKLFETEYIRMFSFYIPDGRDPTDFQEEVLRRLERLIEYAEKNGVVLLHENEKKIFGDDAERCLTLFRELYGPNFRCTFDPANFIQCGQDTLEAYDMLRPYLCYLHVKDALKGSGTVVPAGKGDGNLPVLLGRLKESGYQGFVSLEPHLTDFSGFAALEKGPKKARKTEANGEEAFLTAFRALSGLLSNL